MIPLHLLNKDVLMFLLQSKINKWKKEFWANGGFTSKKNLFYILISK